MGSAKNSTESMVRKVSFELAGEMARASGGRFGPGTSKVAMIVATQAIRGTVDLFVLRDAERSDPAFAGTTDRILKAWIVRALDIRDLLEKNWSHFDDGPATPPVAGSRNVAKTLPSEPDRRSSSDLWQDEKIWTPGTDFMVRHRVADSKTIQSYLQKVPKRTPLSKVVAHLRNTWGASFVAWGDGKPGHWNVFAKG